MEGAVWSSGRRREEKRPPASEKAAGVGGHPPPLLSFAYVFFSLDLSSSNFLEIYLSYLLISLPHYNMNFIRQGSLPVLLLAISLSPKSTVCHREDDQYTFVI